MTLVEEIKEEQKRKIEPIPNPSNDPSIDMFNKLAEAHLHSLFLKIYCPNSAEGIV